MKPKDIGTRHETAVVRFLVDNGMPHAERRALAGAGDLGDITGTPGLAWSCKGGKTAETAGDVAVAKWMSEMERMRERARADIAVLVMARAGIGPKRIGDCWAVVPALTFTRLSVAGVRPLRMHLAPMVLVLRANGYGEPLTAEELDGLPYGGVVTSGLVASARSVPSVASVMAASAAVTRSVGRPVSGVA